MLKAREPLADRLFIWSQEKDKFVIDVSKTIEFSGKIWYSKIVVILAIVKDRKAFQYQSYARDYMDNKKERVQDEISQI